MRAFIIGFILGVVIIPIAVYGYFASGSAPVATASEAMPFEKKLARKALHARIAKEKPTGSIPVEAGEPTYTAGAQIYHEHCAVCHGVPGQAPTAIANGMYPKPPQLFHGKGVTDDEPAETYWLVANGVRLTGMPAFNKSLTETQLWQVTLLLANADKVSDSVKQQVITGQPALPAPSPAPAKK